MREGRIGNLRLRTAGRKSHRFVVDDLAQTRSKLDTLGIKIENEADYPPGVRLYIFDPNGIELELVGYGPNDPAHREVG